MINHNPENQDNMIRIKSLNDWNETKIKDSKDEK